MDGSGATTGAEEGSALANGVPVYPVTLVIVSDFESGEKTWADERTAVDHYLADPTGLPAEIIVMATEQDVADPGRVPDWADAPVPVSVRPGTGTRAMSLKNQAVSLCRSEIVAVTEADNLGAPGYIRDGYRFMNERPEVDVLAARTLYPDTGSLSRAATLLDRGYFFIPDWRGGDGHVCTNGGFIRRAVLERYPHPDDPSSFIANHRRQIAMKEDGVHIAFAPEIVQYHHFEGMEFWKDVRRNKGLQHFRMQPYTRQDDWRGKSLLRQRIWSVLCCFRNDIQSIRAGYFHYCRKRDMPLVLGLMAMSRFYEWQGSGQAARGAARPEGTAFR